MENSYNYGSSKIQIDATVINVRFCTLRVLMVYHLYRLEEIGR